MNWNWRWSAHSSSSTPPFEAVLYLEKPTKSSLFIAMFSDNKVFGRVNTLGSHP